MTTGTRGSDGQSGAQDGGIQASDWKVRATHENMEGGQGLIRATRAVVQAGSFFALPSEAQRESTSDDFPQQLTQTRGYVSLPDVSHAGAEVHMGTKQSVHEIGPFVSNRGQAMGEHRGECTETHS